MPMWTARIFRHFADIVLPVYAGIDFYEGHVYIAMPPLYKAMPKRGEEEYLYDDDGVGKVPRKP